MTREESFIMQYERLACKLARRYAAWNLHTTFEDNRQACLIGAMRAYGLVDKDSHEGAVYMYVLRCMKTEMLHSARAQNMAGHRRKGEEKVRFTELPEITSDEDLERDAAKEELLNYLFAVARREIPTNGELLEDFYRYGFSAKEVGDKHGISEGAARERKYRALRAVRTALRASSSQIF